MHFFPPTFLIIFKNVPTNVFSQQTKNQISSLLACFTFSPSDKEKEKVLRIFFVRKT